MRERSTRLEKLREIPYRTLTGGNERLLVSRLCPNRFLKVVLRLIASSCLSRSCRLSRRRLLLRSRRRRIPTEDAAENRTACLDCTPDQ